MIKFNIDSCKTLILFYLCIFFHVFYSQTPFYLKANLSFHLCINYSSFLGSEQLSQLSVTPFYLKYTTNSEYLHCHVLWMDIQTFDILFTQKVCVFIRAKMKVFPVISDDVQWVFMSSFASILHQTLNILSIYV